MDQPGRTLLRAPDRTCLKRGVFRSVADLEEAIKVCIRATNADPKPFRWTKSASDILATIQRFCLRTLAANA